MKNLGNFMKQAQQMQQKMADLQTKLEETEMVGKSGGGMVHVTLTGKSDMKKVTIDPAVLDPEDIGIVEDLVVAAYNDAKQKVEKLTQDEMQKVTGGLALPPGMKFPF